MTLKDKLFNTVFDNAWEYKHENTVPELEQIADEYAIEFAEWIIDTDNKPVGEFTIKELLEIFKN